jgi:DNA-binding GntR family transcriptional regulator
MMQVARDPYKVAMLNRKFHGCILSAARNRFLAQSHNSLSHALVLLGKTTLESSERVRDVVSQHDAIVEALKSGQPETAAKLMRTHMEASLEHRLKALQLDG